MGILKLLEIIENAIHSGLQAALQAFGNDKILIHTGKKILNVIKSPKDLRISKIMRKLEEMHNTYEDKDGNSLLLGGYNSYLTPEKILNIAMEHKFSKYKTFSMDDANLISEILKYINMNRIVAVVADTNQNIIDMYLEPTLSSYTNYSSSLYSDNKQLEKGWFESVFPGISIGGLIGFIVGFFSCFSNPQDPDFGRPFVNAFWFSLIGGLIAIFIKLSKSNK